jgi:hypothetical protein
MSEAQMMVDTIQEGLGVRLINNNQAFELVKRLNREKRFVQKIQRMVKDVEHGANSSSLEEDGKAKTQQLRGSLNPSSSPSIADCWRWVKGLLHDFISLKKHTAKIEDRYIQLYKETTVKT